VGKATFLVMEGKPIKLKAGAAKQRERDGRKPRYGPEVIESLRRIWTFFWYRCGEYLTHCQQVKGNPLSTV
jgi:hypothetical protein